MKKFISLGSLILCSVLSSGLMLTSCSKDDDEDQSNVNEFKATVNGTLWEGTIGSTATSGGTRQINASKGDGTTFQLFFPENASGSYDLAVSNAVTVSYSTGSVFWSNELSGTLILDKNTAASGSGTFNAVLTSAFNTDTLKITNGSFWWQF